MIASHSQETRRWTVPFFTIWTAQAFSLAGSMLVHFALIWWLTKTTGSATVLAISTIVSMLPNILLGPLAGAYVDRWNRRIVMMVADGIIALATLVVALIYAAGVMQVWHVYLILCLRSVANSFHWPAMQSSTSLMVPKEHLARVAGMNQALHGVTNIITPPLGALLLSLMPMQNVLAIDVVTAVLAISPLFFVVIPQPPRQAVEQKKPSVWQDLRAGLSYVRGWPALMLIIIMSALINMVVTPAYSLIPLLVTEHFHGEALQLGWINSAAGLGVVLGGLALSAWGGFRRRVLTMLLGLGGMGLGAVLVGIAPESAFGMALAGLFLAGFMNPICNGPLFALIQGTVDPKMQGRVLTLMLSGATAMAPLSLAIAGPLVDVTGVQTWYLAGGILCVVMAALPRAIPVLWRMEESLRGYQAAEPAAEAEPIEV